MLKLATLLLLIAWRIYWLITEKRADKEKPKTQQQPAFFSKKRLRRNFLLTLLSLVLALQLLGVRILYMPTTSFFQLLGFFMVLIGLSVAIRARIDLGTNWANAYEYQIKQKQELITNGIYFYIRHPIYIGMGLAGIGAELVSQSYLFIAFLVLIWGAYKQTLLEEKILIKHFGAAYKNYMKRTKRFIPFVW